MVTKRDRSNYLIQSVTHALEVLEALSNERDEMGITELAKQLGLHKNNVFRLLATLGLKGFIQQNPHTEAYSLGPACLKLGQSYLLNSDLITRIRPLLSELNEQTSETVSFARLINGEIHFPISIGSQKSVAVSPRVGVTMAAEECAIGKLLLAQTDANNWQDSSHKKQIKELSGASHFVDNNNEAQDVLSVTMLVRGLGNAVIGAVEVLAPTYRAKSENILPALSDTVNQINECFAAEKISLSDRIEKEVSGGAKAITEAETQLTGAA